jgi:ABC-type phosphate transport system substrate-binding protein
VIAHVSIPYSSLTKEELSNLFLKKITRWKETDKFVYPVDLFEDSPVRRQFSEEIHGKEVAAIKAYWQQQIFSGREIPPLERNSDQDVLQYVEQKAGAIGYVSKSVDITQYNIKVIEIVEGNQK